MAKNTNSRETIDKAVELFQKGERIRDVMRKTGITKHTAQKLREYCGYVPVRQRIINALKAHPNVTTVKISDIADCSYVHARTVRKELGL